MITMIKASGAMITASEAGRLSEESRKEKCAEVTAKYGEEVTAAVTQAAMQGRTSAKVQVDDADVDHMIRALTQLGYIVVGTGIRSVTVAWGAP